MPQTSCAVENVQTSENYSPLPQFCTHFWEGPLTMVPHSHIESASILQSFRQNHFLPVRPIHSHLQLPQLITSGPVPSS